MSNLKISVVCCDPSPEKWSRIVETTVDASLLNDRLLETAEQQLPAHEEKGLHNAALHTEHGAVTYLQQVNEGGFGVLVGDPDDLRETFFPAGSLVAFIDSEGPGHASKVGPEGVKRTFSMLKGHLDVE
jgi:hypothetical protein